MFFFRLRSNEDKQWSSKSNTHYFEWITALLRNVAFTLCASDICNQYYIYVTGTAFIKKTLLLLLTFNHIQ